jgi:hypothetical protein
MSQPQPNILQLAKQGNPKAIAALINRQLQAKGITVKVSIQDSSLEVILEALEIPNQKTLVAYIHKGIMSLESTAIKTIKISGKCINKDFLSWTQEIEIKLQYDEDYEDEDYEDEDYEDEDYEDEDYEDEDYEDEDYEAKKNQLFENSYSYQTNKKHDYAAITNSVKLKSTSDLNIVQKYNKEKNYQRKLNKEIPIKFTLPIIIGLAIYFLLIVMYATNNLVGAIGSDRSDSSNTSPAPDSEIQISGNLELSTGSGVTGTDIIVGGDTCGGNGGYADIQEGMTVTIKDGQGKILALGKTTAGTYPPHESGFKCNFPFQVHNVPKADFYSIEVGHRGQLNFSYEELKSKNWQVSFTVG